MPTTTFEERLAEMGHQIDGLEAMARAGGGEAKSRIQRQLGALRQQEASARAAAHEGAEPFDEKFEQFEARFRVAESSLAADLADNRKNFADAVENELHSWDTYFERLQAQTAMRAASARKQSEAAISDLRRRRNTLAEQLAEARSASVEAWDEQRERIAAARDDLERKADEVSAKFN
jgi:vacuolar-type H+-ATPase catalytic subunit A/Vma1